MDSFFSWDMLTTFAGASAATGIITEAIKGAFQKIPTQIVSYIVAVIVLTLSTGATTGFAAEWSLWAMVPINAILVSLAANGGFQALQRTKKE